MTEASTNSSVEVKVSKGPPFSAGDAVQLKSGGTVMTVMRCDNMNVDHAPYTCELAYFDNKGTLQIQKQVPAACLRDWAEAYSVPSVQAPPLEGSHEWKLVPLPHTTITCDTEAEGGSFPPDSAVAAKPDGEEPCTS